MTTDRRNRIKQSIHVGVGDEWLNEALLVTFPLRMERFTPADHIRYDVLVNRFLEDTTNDHSHSNR